MSHASVAYQRERRMRSLDTIAVHNPTSEDFIFWEDKFGPSPRKLMVPKSQKDIGFGKGNNHLPRYLAQRFTRDMITQIINGISDKDWAEKKKQYRTHDETLQHAPKVQIRTNDTTLWGEWFPKIWLGLVEKFGGDAIPDPVDPMIPDSGDPFTDTMNKLSLEDKPYEQEPTTKSA